MSNRKKMSKRKSNYSFAKNKYKTDGRNHTAYRGGIRL